MARGAPTFGHMNDRVLVGAILSGDPEALDALYDTHAERLYAYCWFLVRNHEIAQVALRDAFVVAEARIEELSDPLRFGVWLYALARNECCRRDASWVSGPDVPLTSPDQPDADVRMVAWRAMLGLSPLRRELLELHLRHRLDEADLADVLGLEPRTVPALLDDARRRLERAVVGEILAQRQPHECPARYRILRYRHGDLTDGLRERLLRHKRSCTECAKYAPRNVSAAKVYAMLPWPTPPEPLRDMVMNCFADPDLAGYRSFVADRAGAVDSGGFPARADGFGRRSAQGSAALRRRRRPVAGVAAAAVAVIVTQLGMQWLAQRFEHRSPAAGRTVAGADASRVDRHSAGPVEPVAPVEPDAPSRTGSPPADPTAPTGVTAAMASLPLGARVPALPPTALSLFRLSHPRDGTSGPSAGPSVGSVVEPDGAASEDSRSPSPRPLPGVPPGGPEPRAAKRTGGGGVDSGRRRQQGRQASHGERGSFDGARSPRVRRARPVRPLRPVRTGRRATPGDGRPGHGREPAGGASPGDPGLPAPTVTAAPASPAPPAEPSGA